MHDRARKSISNKEKPLYSDKSTPSNPYYLSQIWMYLDIFLVLDTSVFAKGNMGRREYNNDYNFFEEIIISEIKPCIDGNDQLQLLQSFRL
jgi:hypothetical protein